MKPIKDYHKCYEELELGSQHMYVYNRRSRVKRSLDRLKKTLESSGNSRTKLKQYYKIYLLDGVRIRKGDLLILPYMVGKVVRIYNGKFYQHVKLFQEIVGSYVSEFVKTRKKGSHSKKGQKPIKRT